MTYDDCEEFLARVHDEYEDGIADGDGENAAMDGALDGLDNESMLKLIWATGCVDDAFDAVLDDVERAVADGPARR